MAEHRVSEALPVGPTQLPPEQQKAQEIKEPVGESPLATQSQKSELPSSDENSNSETLIAFPSSVLDQPSFDVQGIPDTLSSVAKSEIKETVGPPENEKEVAKSEAAQEPSAQAEYQIQVTVSLTPPSELSPNSVAKSFSSVPSPTIQIQNMSPPNVSNTPVAEVNKKNTSGGRALSSVSVPRTPSSDGFNWRKYGQKQVKSPTTGSRSYYRCTQSNCCAKKIECWDHSGHVIETVYKSEHSHDPPRKISSIRESKFAPSNEPTAENSVLVKPADALKDSDPSTSSKAQEETPCSSDKKLQNSSDINGNGKIVLNEEHVDEPDPKRRKDKGDLVHSDSPVKPEKKPKFVVHAAGDVGISGDGYRWRKYGQKMVKGNPHPRNYYRCTSAGCPVRKHVETAVDSSDAVIITYKGVHDHDTPVPKKRHGPPSAPLVAAAAPASMNNLQCPPSAPLVADAAPASLNNLQLSKPDSPQNQKISTQWSVDTEGELTGEAKDLGGEKAIESARTLLSIGFEIKPC
ncbi:putative transcription factor WRKY family [Medicago truncatula]|uniref:Putative transcription factor WRKY family n=1 Tax=Medicago truncatula TaxID=3880 RepID=A0A396IJP5_MEDTR|nr:probable WRKY transcription factor 32 [Medicago truncatula]RHN64893.1 putative transcription factor WRKY family [Medicago truncatula]